MAQRPSRYSDTRDYDHQFHAGNVGDVFKHCALRAWVAALQADTPLHVVDTHAGAGMFKLAPQGEWLQGIGLLDAADTSNAPAIVQGYVQAASMRRAKGKGGLYPGSPALVRALLGSADRLSLFELMDAPREKLANHYEADPQVAVNAGDGLAGLVDLAATSTSGRLAAVIDPPYVSRKEWDLVAARAIEAKTARPELALCIWYPIKSQVRPRGLAAQLRNAGIAGASVDLVHTPLRLQRKRLNGSGLLFVDPPAGVLSAVHEAALWLGPRLATDGEWTAITTGWDGHKGGTREVRE